MTWRLAQSLVKLRDQVNAQAPNRSRASDGTIGDAAHASSQSDHNPNSSGVVCAMDITHDPAGGLDAHALADHLIANRNYQLKYVVSNSRIAGAWSGWQWQSYNGSNPHDHHIHVSVGVGGDGYSVQPYDDTRDWDINYLKGDSLMIIQNADNWYNRCNKTHLLIRGRELGRDVFAAFVGKEFLSFVEVCSDDPEAEKVQNWQTVGKRAVADKWDVQISTLQDQVKALNTRPTSAQLKAIQDKADALAKSLDIAVKAGTAAAKKTAELETASLEAQKTGNAFVRWIGELLNKTLGKV